jgi:tetratricopeptide (TPR) repeat protein
MMSSSGEGKHAMSTKGFLISLMVLPLLWSCSARNQKDAQPYEDIPIRMMKLLEAAERERDLSKHRWCSISDLTDQLASIKRDMARGVPFERVERNVSAAERFATAYELQYRMSENLEAYSTLDIVIRLYTEAIELNAGYAEAYDNRGEAYLVKGDFSQALSDLHKAIELKPELANAYNGLGNIYHLERDFDQAIQYYSKAIELSWGFAVAWTNRGDAYMARGDLGEAMWDFNVACQLGYQPACKELHVLER